MTDGEKMIWAAAFVKKLDLSNPPREVVLPGNTEQWKEWESTQTHHAIEWASGAVEHAREELKSIEEGFGKSSSVYRMLKAMVE